MTRKWLEVCHLERTIIGPDYNILPLIGWHFKERFHDQKWIIYDIKRNYGIYYDLKDLGTVTFEDLPVAKNQIPHELLTNDELGFQKLWKNYFNSVNISERKNPKLQMNWMPKKFWKYLIEKEG